MSINTDFTTALELGAYMVLSYLEAPRVSSLCQTFTTPAPMLPSILSLTVGWKARALAWLTSLQVWVPPRPPSALMQLAWAHDMGDSHTHMSNRPASPSFLPLPGITKGIESAQSYIVPRVRRGWRLQGVRKMRRRV